MGKKVLIDAVVTIAGNDLTNNISKVELNDEFEEKEITTYGSGGAREVLAGLESGSVSVTFKNDYAVGSVDEVMWGLRRQVVECTVKPSAEPVSPSNPKYVFNILINRWTPIAGSVGDVAEVDVEFPMSGPMDRQTS